MAEMGVFLDKNTVRFEQLLNAPIEKVWDALTTPRGLAAWLMACDGIRESGLVELKADAPDPSGKYHTTIGVVSEFSPPHRLAYSWFEPSEDASTFVRFELESRRDKVLLRLTHSSLKPEWMPLVGAGWQLNIDRLIAWVETEKTVSFDYQQFTDLIGKYTIALTAAGIVLSSAAPAASAKSSDNAYLEITAQRNILLRKYDEIWKDARELERKYDLLKGSSSNIDRALDEIDRDIKDKLRDLRTVELDIRDLDKALL